MLDTAAPTADRVASATIATSDLGAHPRLLVQARARHTKRRHFIRALRRVAILASADLSLVLAAAEILRFARSSPQIGSLAAYLFPNVILAGWGSVAAILTGLVIVGSYSAGERWAAPGTALKGVALGTALIVWQSIDASGVGWAFLRWIAIVATLGLAIALLRHLLAIVVLRHLLAAGPPDHMIFAGDPTSDAGKEALRVLAERPGTLSLGWLSERTHVDDYLGHPSAVWEVLCETGTDTVVLAGELSPPVFDTVVEAAAVAGCRVLSVRSRHTLAASRPRAQNGHEVRILELTFPAARAGQDGVKRAFDLIVASALLALLSPVALMLSVWIKLDSPGPILFVQDRVGQAGTIFPMMKFRTMRDGADRAKADVAHLNESGDPRLFKIRNDPRITRAGAFLRRWSLDELPQLVNVLRGEMSLVGPRPFFESDLAAYDDHHFIRLSVKPGVTGLWQVRGRSSILDFEEVVNLDREYVESWSFLLDLRILLETFPAVVRRTGAY